MSFDRVRLSAHAGAIDKSGETHNTIQFALLESIHTNINDVIGFLINTNQRETLISLLAVFNEAHPIEVSQRGQIMIEFCLKGIVEQIQQTRLLNFNGDGSAVEKVGAEIKNIISEIEKLHQSCSSGEINEL